jgi:hypothetical protein
MFELLNQSAKIAHVNLREEKHGEEDVLACDLKIETKMSNTFLSKLQPGLRESLYERGRSSRSTSATTRCRSCATQLLAGPLKWEGKIVGGRVTCTRRSAMMT